MAAKYSIKYTSKYKKARKKLLKQNIDLKPLNVLENELKSQNFTHAYKNHKLSGYKDETWECHIGSVTSDWVLIYRYLHNELQLLLLDTGSHSEMFENLVTIRERRS